MPQEHRKRRTGTQSIIAFLAAFIILMVTAGVGYYLVNNYKKAMDGGNAKVERLVRITSEHVEQAFLMVDMTLQRAVDRQYMNALFGGNLREDMQHNLNLWVKEVPQIGLMALINASGNLEAYSEKEEYKNELLLNQPERAQKFLQRMRGDKRLYYMTSPTRERPLLILKRQVYDINGEFGGMVLAVVDPMHFVDFFQSIEQGSHSVLAIYHENGTQLAAGPYEDPYLEKEMPFFIKRISVAKPQNGPGLEYREWGESQRLLSYDMLDHLPIVVAAMISDEDFLEGWRAERLGLFIVVGFTIFFTMVFSGLSIAMAKQLQRIEESESAAVLASQAKSEFLANMSHELRTPLNAIIGFSEMLDSGYFGPMNSKQKERVHDINLCGTHLLQLINDILDFSKGEAGKLELQEEEISIVDIVTQGMRIMQEKAQAKGITLATDIAPNLPPLWADKRKVRQILLNLLSNAVKFTPEGGTVSASVKLDSQQQMYIIVEDSGIGMAQADIPKALSVFGQVHRSSSHEGTGLGLPLCRMLAELHGGELQLESEKGVGTRVSVILPLHRKRA